MAQIKHIFHYLLLVIAKSTRYCPQLASANKYGCFKVCNLLDKNVKYCYAITKSDGSPTFGKRINDATVTLKINIRGDLYYRLHTQKRHKNFDYSTIMDRLKAVSWGNKSHPISVVNLFTGY